MNSSGKRLTPRTVAVGQYEGNGFSVQINKQAYYTSEVLQDDGTYVDSSPYIYWWDVGGRYHQHFMTGGQIVHLSSQPLGVNANEIRINLSRERPGK